MNGLRLPKSSHRFEPKLVDVQMTDSSPPPPPPPPPPQASTSHPNPTLEARLIHSARQQQIKLQARMKRAENKSPFLPKKSKSSIGGAGGASGKGKGREFETIDDVRDALERCSSLLLDKSTMELLPESSDEKLKNQQGRLQLRLSELESMNRIRTDLENTTIQEPAHSEEARVKSEELDNDFAAKIDIRDDDLKPLTSVNVASTTSSPSTAKTRLALRASISSSPTNSSITSIPLYESLRLQEQAALRERQAIEKRNQALRLKEQLRNKRTGGSLKAALKGHEQGQRLEQFFSHEDSDPEEDDDEEILHEAEEILFGMSATGSQSQGQLNDEEDEQLNPYRHAYNEGYQRAILEEGKERGTGR